MTEVCFFSKMKPWQLRNHYLLVRHGESTANVEGLVVTDPAVGCFKYGLTPKGEIQAKESAKSVMDLMDKHNFALKDVCICYSDFKRTKETAQIIYKQLNEDKFDIDNGSKFISSKLLRERRFGDLDKNDGTLNYEIVWIYDKMDANHTRYRVESVNKTLQRIKLFIQEIERKYDNKLIIIVSHGDICQITQTFFEDIPSNMHHDLPYIQNAEVRDLTAIANKMRKSKL